MIVLIVCVCIGGYLFYRIEKEDKVIKALFTLMGVCVGLLAGMAITGISSVVVPSTVHHYEFEKVELVTLGSASELQGSFFLASGSVGAEQYYKFYYKTADGGKKFGKIQAESATVYEEDRKDAYMAKAGEENRYSTNDYLWLIPKFLWGRPLWKYTIHVPKGTIKVEYNLDLK